MYDSRNMQDVTAPLDLEIEIRSDGQVVWIHVDGITALRVCRMGKLRVTDHRATNPDSVMAILEELKDAEDIPMHHRADIDQFLTETEGG